jgi:hypothetical protein
MSVPDEQSRLGGDVATGQQPTLDWTHGTPTDKAVLTKADIANLKATSESV